MQELSPTARVILGMLKLGVRTGYDIKQACERTTRHFWGASYGQIYPELRRLEESGLVDGEDDPRGGVRRRPYRLTEAGERALTGWLTSGAAPETFVRDEGLLKLFFGELVPRDALLEHVRRIRDNYAGGLAELEAVWSGVDDFDDPSFETLRYGFDFYAWNVAWWTELEHRLSSEG